MRGYIEYITDCAVSLAASASARGLSVKRFHTIKKNQDYHKCHARVLSVMQAAFAALAMFSDPASKLKMAEKRMSLKSGISKKRDCNSFFYFI